MTALNQNVSNCLNTLTVPTLKWRIFLQDVGMGQMCMTRVQYATRRNWTKGLIVIYQMLQMSIYHLGVKKIKLVINK